MNTIESLQALYVKLGGSLTDTYEDIAGGVPVSDYSIIPDMIAAVATKATSGGGGGNTIFVVNLTRNEQLLVGDRTYGEIYAASKAGKPVIFNYIADNEDGDGTYKVNRYYLSYIYYTEPDGGLIIYQVNVFDPTHYESGFSDSSGGYSDTFSLALS